MSDDDDAVDDILEEIEAALEEGRIDAALRLAEKARKSHPDDPDLAWTYADVLWDAGALRAARDAYVEATRLAPDAPEILQSLAWCYFALAEFPLAAQAAKRALEAAEIASCLALLGRVAERDGDLAEADRRLRRAHALDPDNHPLPFRIGEEEFRELVGQALDSLPEKFRRACDGEVAVLVEPVPPLAVLVSEEPPLDPELLGLYTGIPLPERHSSSELPKLPDVIYLFQRNLEHEALDRAELVEQITITVLHEIGHYFGFDDDELDELDVG